MKTGYVCIDGQYYAPNHPFVKTNKFVTRPFETHEFVTSPMPKKKRIRQSSKPLMNKLEQEYYDSLRERVCVREGLIIQGLRFRLGNGIWYKPDFIVVNHPLEAYEIKGPHAFRGGFENLKVAASQYKQFKWFLVWKENGQWQEQRVLP